MANSYVIQSVKEVGTTLMISGTVNGNYVSFNMDSSLLPAGAMASAVSFLNGVYPFMLQAYNNQNPSNLLLTGSITV